MSEAIMNVMHEHRLFKPPKHLKNSHVDSFLKYKRMYNESVKHPAKFWGAQSKNVSWFKSFGKVLDWNAPNAKWFIGGKLNVCYNCLDRHLETRKNKVALIWESNKGETIKYTYLQLYEQVCKFANVLRKRKIKKGDRVVIYMPMIPEGIIAMLACARIGAIHSVVFGGFSSQSLNDRIHDSQAKALITADGYEHGKKKIDMNKNVREGLKGATSINSVFIVKNLKNKISFKKGRDYYWHEEMKDSPTKSECEPMDSEDPLFILYTSGTTGKPKGVIHTTGGYLVYVTLTTKYVFDLQPKDVYWCTADIGWITGHSYIVYGPLSNGTTTLVFEGIPTYPTPDRFWEIIEKHKVNVFYTAPTAIRALEKEGDKWPLKHKLKSLRVLGSVGEPINSEAWMWYHKIIGKNRCPIVDTWWQTETGGILITPLPGATSTKPGSCCFPFFGIVPKVYKEDGSKAKINEGGYLVIEKPWPSMIRGVWGDPRRFKKTYFSQFPGVYSVGDTARVDKDGYFWVLGRADDVLNISGHRIGTAEVESAINSHPSCAESAVVGVADEIKGSALYSFVTLKTGFKEGSKLVNDIRNHVGKVIGPIAKPSYVQFVPGLPKTRSGKIMRRILKKIANGSEDMGNITTLANPEIVALVKKGRLKIDH